MSKYIIDGNTLTSMANAIRTKTGKTNAFTPSQMITEIENIPTGGNDDIMPYQYSGSNISSYTGNVQYILDGGFYNCANLTTVSFPKCIYISNLVFYGCSNLSSLYLNQVTSVPILEDSNAFDYTPLSAGGSGKIYVPSSLYAAFQTANRWSTIKARLVSM